MKRILTLIFTLAAFIQLQAQDHTITVSNNVFTPENLTVQVGETVQWTNTQGFHNVNGGTDVYPSNPEGFDNGTASSDAWTFEHTFTIPGTYTYQCDPHAGVGMIGSITVEGGGNTSSDIVITEIMYNSPNGNDLEFVELYNNTDSNIDLTDWSFTSGFDFVFPAFVLAAGEYTLVASDGLAVLDIFGVTGFEWTGGGLSNGGEAITLVDANMSVVDSVDYDDGSGWPEIADGDGPSLVLCDFNSDNNDPVNWQRAITFADYIENCKEVFANPGMGATCTISPIITFELSCLEVNENVGEITVEVLLDNPRDIDTAVEINVDGSSTATNGEDFSLTDPLTVVFPAGTDTAQTFILPIIDDAIMNEGDETIVLSLATVGDGIVTGTTLQTITIGDNDVELTNALRLTGVFDGPLTGGVPKGIEIFASDNIDDLSAFGVGTANNGGGTDGEEFSFPNIAVTAGTFIYVTNDSAGFNDFFGFYPDAIYIDGSVNINGDDAIELFESGQVIDVFGDINVDGSGEAWEYLDSWAYRKSATGPDGNMFVLDNWIFGGVDVFDGNTVNSTATSPFPIGTYMIDLGNMIIANDDSAETGLNTPVTIDVLGNDVLPNEVELMEILENGAIGTAIVNANFTITYTPNMDECGEDMVIYYICDADTCNAATIFISVTCPVTYPMATIASVTGTEDNGIATSLDQTLELQGVVHGNDFRGGTGVQFTMIDETGGIAVFEFDIDYYEPMEGDEIIARGSIGQFRGLTQMNPDTIIVLSSDNPLMTATVVSELNESTESEMVKLDNLTIVDPSEWTNDGTGFNVNVTDGTNTYLMRIDNDTNIFGTTAPDFTFHLTGIGSQFDDGELPFTDGYQIYPRYLADIEMVTSVDEPFINGKMSVFPNPVAEVLSLQTELDIDRIEVVNVLGQTIIHQAFSPTLDCSTWTAGVYYLTFVRGEERWTTKVVKR